MNSSSTDTISISKILNKWIYPVLLSSITFVFLASYTLEYTTLVRFIPEEKKEIVRHAYHSIGLIPTIGTGMIIAIVSLTIWVFDRCTVRKITRIANKARTRYLRGNANPVSVPSRIKEIFDLGFVFDRLFAEQLKRVEELIDVNCAIRHNASNLLTQIRNDADAIACSSVQFQHLASRIVSDVDRLVLMLGRSLSIMENYNRICQTQPMPINLNELVCTCLEAHEPIAIEKDISLACIMPDDPISFYGHEQKIMNLLHNLIDNAIKFTPPYGSVSVSLIGNKGNVSIAVADTGIGIEAKDIERIFKRGVRLEAAKSTSGSGYGLSFVDSIVTFYRGTVTCDSSFGKGSVFTVTLPSDCNERIHA